MCAHYIVTFLSFIDAKIRQEIQCNTEPECTEGVSLEYSSIDRVGLDVLLGYFDLEVVIHVDISVCMS